MMPKHVEGTSKIIDDYLLLIVPITALTTVHRPLVPDRVNNLRWHIRSHSIWNWVIYGVIFLENNLVRIDILYMNNILVKMLNKIYI
jgi:hypothetical protein